MKHPELIETHRVGAGTRETVIRAEDCPLLGAHHIAHVGIADAAEPYAMVRTDLPGSYFLSCFGGEGRIYLDGRWQPCGSGMACLAPAHLLHAFHAIPNRRWEFAWVRYDPLAGAGPLGAASAPVLAKFPAEPLRHAVGGLIAEHQANSSPAALHHWVELIHGYVVRFAQPWHVDHRLTKVWEAVAFQPGHSWTLGELAAQAHCSAEHLRRLCRKQLGRSPMQQVTYLRMRRAAAILAETEEKLESIACEVGYANPFVFSNTFKRWTGWRPSEYRARQQKPGKAAIQSSPG
jgi:AraC-like DNA-binding protein